MRAGSVASLLVRSAAVGVATVGVLETPKFIFNPTEYKFSPQRVAGEFAFGTLTSFVSWR